MYIRLDLVELYENKSKQPPYSRIKHCLVAISRSAALILSSPQIDP